MEYRQTLKHFSAETLLTMWRQDAAALIARGHASDDEIARLNTIALEYGARKGIRVPLSGQDPVDPTTPDEDGPPAPLWVVNKEETQDHWLEINDGEGWWSAQVKWDGCIHFYRYYNEPWGRKDDAPDYLHICDIDDLIERLQALKATAIEHFGKVWPNT